MKTNRRNKNKGWRLFFLCVILVLQVFLMKNVYATEEVSIENIELKQEVEEVLNKEIEEESNIIIPEEIEEENIEEEQVEFTTKEDIWQFYSTDMEFTEEEVIIQNKINESILVEDILKNIKLEVLKEEYNVKEIYVINEEGTFLTTIDIINGGNKLIFIGEDYISSYEIKVLGDYTNDGIVNTEDVEEAIENNVTEENIITTEEVSYIDYVVNNNTYEVEEIITPSQDNLENTLEVENQDIYIEEEITVKYSIEGLKESNIDTISASINYDHNALELVDIYFSDNNVKQGKINDQYFIYILNELKEETPLVMFLFKTKTSGTYKVSLENIKLAYQGTLLEVNNNTSIEFLVQEYGKGGDVPSNIPPIIQETPTTSSTIPKKEQAIPITLEKNNTVQDSPIITSTEIYLSNDNYINDLMIKEYPIIFDKNKNIYKIEIDYNINQLTLELDLSNDNATYFITGNKNLKPGKNNVVLTVQAEDGSTRDYVIEVNKKTKKEIEEKTAEEKLKKIISMIILGILIVSIIWCIYLLIKKDEQ